MALKKSAIYKGFTVSEGYYAITGTKINPHRDSEGVKKYGVTLVVSLFKDSTKAVMLENKVRKSDLEDTEFRYNVLEKDLTYKNFYTLLKAEEFFDGATDV